MAIECRITRCMQFADAHPNCAFGTTSHTPKTLGAICRKKFKRNREWMT